MLPGYVPIPSGASSTAGGGRGHRPCSHTLERASPVTHTEDMTRAELTAILTATREDALHLDDGSYIDWSDPDVLEVGDAEGNAVQVPFTFADLKNLVHKLAATVLAE